MQGVLDYLELESLNNEGFTKLKTNQKVIKLNDLLFNYLSDYKEPCYALFKYFLLPQNFLQKEKFFWKISDQFWFISKDESVDLNYYSKRLILQNALKLTFTYWFSDDSENSISTKQFFVNSINQVAKIGKIKNSFKIFWKNLNSRIN